ncbi:uncharacterized protein LOC135707865 [Ochlerotatus camptorhynchus]|uniref:uncharacterized protein LOC135707865 n=1 Tax=Ochlerotatus camptorhynchus TaxID=644619 RepID=UPI0031D23CA2
MIVQKLNEAMDEPETASLSQLKAYEKKLELHYSEYAVKHDLIVTQCTSENMEDQDNKLDEFDELHTEALVKLNQLLELLRADPQPNNGVPQVIVTQQPLKTPIPTFDGKYEGWPKFKALFNDLIRKCGDSDATKLQYLDKALIGEASGILNARIINDNNYQQAWELLEERFENPRVIIDTHISGLLSMKPIAKQSFKELRNLIDTCNRHVEGLRFMEQEVVGTAGLIVVKLLTMCLDGETRKQWELTMEHGELPDLEESMKFLRSYCQVLERCEVDKASSAKAAVKPPMMGKTSSSQRTSNPATSSSPENVCEICAGQHCNYKCPSFLSMSVDQRVTKVKQIGLCFNCLRKGHQIRACPSDKSCSRCSKKHHTMLHFEQVSQADPKQKTPGGTSKPQEMQTAAAVPEDPVSTACSSMQQRAKQVFLMTALVNVTSKSGRNFKLRALFDSGSQINLVSESAVKLLALPKYPANVPVVGVGGARSQIRHRVILKCFSDYTDFQSDMDCLVTARVTGKIPSVPVDISEWKFPSGIVLADPSFNEPREVDLLIGAELFFKILKQAQLKLSDNLPVLFETQFGWVIAGALEESEEEVVNVLCATNEDLLLKSIQRFFEQEELPEEKVLTNEEQAIEDHFCKTYRRDEDGRFVVQLPFRESINELGNSRSLALKRFLSIEKHLTNKPEMKEMYQEFMQEYKDLGHCHEIREEDDPPGQQSYYLPHHAVLKPTSTSTKLREKMFRQVKLDPRQTHYHRTFWRDQPMDPIKVMELLTVTYGTSPASFLAVRSMVQLAREERANFPAAAEAILEDCYMDDILSGAPTLASAKQLRSDIEELMMKGKFPIRKWCTNDDEILEGVPDQDREKLVRIGDSGTNEAIRALGVLWDPRCDQFLFWRSPEVMQPDVKVTKRYVLSQIAKLFDPLGLISPVIVLAKSIMQQLWADGLGWDETLEGELLSRCVTLHQSLVQLNEIRIPRCVMAPGAQRIEIHGFSDASCTAYGACVYLRCVQEDGAVSVRLLCSKSRIAPLRRLTIPRLELCAAVVLAKLVSVVIPILKTEFHDIKLWSDSQIVLAWIKKNPDQLQVYVRNRVLDINKLTSTYEWKYVRSENNPADLVSRGCYPGVLHRSDMWWNGPLFLQDVNYDIQETPVIQDEELPEMRQAQVCNPAVDVEDDPVFERCGSFSKLQRVLAQVVRFTRLIRMKKENRKHARYISVQDMRKALDYIVRILQRTGLNEEIQCVQRKELPKRLANLQPFLDEEGFLRVGGRLQNSK